MREGEMRVAILATDEAVEGIALTALVLVDVLDTESVGRIVIVMTLHHNGVVLTVVAMTKFGFGVGFLEDLHGDFLGAVHVRILPTLRRNCNPIAVNFVERNIADIAMTLSVKIGHHCIMHFGSIVKDESLVDIGIVPYSLPRILVGIRNNVTRKEGTRLYNAVDTRMDILLLLTHNALSTLLRNLEDWIEDEKIVSMTLNTASLRVLERPTALREIAVDHHLHGGIVPNWFEECKEE